MTRKHSPSARVVTAFVRIPKPLEDGKARCRACSAVVTLTKNGHLRVHRTPSGEDCPYRAGRALPVDLTDAPTVVKVPRPTTRPDRSSAGVSADSATLLPPTGYCHDCDKRVLPGRRLCAACGLARAAHRGQAAGS